MKDNDVLVGAGVLVALVGTGLTAKYFVDRKKLRKAGTGVDEVDKATGQQQQTQNPTDVATGSAELGDAQFPIKFGMRGYVIAKMQSALNQIPRVEKTIVVDGRFGANTREAINQWFSIWSPRRFACYMDASQCSISQNDFKDILNEANENGFQSKWGQQQSEVAKQWQKESFLNAVSRANVCPPLCDQPRAFVPSARSWYRAPSMSNTGDEMMNRFFER